MRYFLGYAGIPQDFFSRVDSKNPSIVLDNGEFFGFPVSGQQTTYTADYCRKFESRFADRLAHGDERTLSSLGFGLVFIATGDAAADSLMPQTLFPSVLTARVEWAPQRGSATQQRVAANELVDRLREATRRVKAAINVLSEELVRRGNRTPLLLPTQNFRSSVLVEELTTLQRALADEPELAAAVQDSIKRIHRAHPRCQDERSKLTQHVDDRSTSFTAPGRARHGFARTGGDHLKRCLLNGRRRLGAVYEHAFHYDCTREGGSPLSGAFFGCHEDESQKQGHPHLNISPNDHVR